MAPEGKILPVVYQNLENNRYLAINLVWDTEKKEVRLEIEEGRTDPLGKLMKLDGREVKLNREDIKRFIRALEMISEEMDKETD